MKLTTLAFAATFLPSILAIFVPSHYPRALDDILAGPDTKQHGASSIQHTTSSARSGVLSMQTSDLTLSGVVGQATGTKASSITTQITSNTSSKYASTTQPLPTSLPSSIPTSTSSTPTLVSHPIVTPTSTLGAEKSSGASHSSQDWKIIGVAVIAFTAVAAVLLLSVFFDQWWGFIKDMFWKKKRSESMEEIIPDWEKSSRDIWYGAERHRYPSFTSLPSGYSVNHKLDRQSTFRTNVAGVGSGFASSKTQQEQYDHSCPSKHDTYYPHYTPTPPPTAHSNPYSRRLDVTSRTQDRDLNPYDGIVE